MTEVLIAILWLALGWLGTYIGLITFRHRYGSPVEATDPFWFMALLGPFNLLGMLGAIRPWDRSRDL